MIDLVQSVCLIGLIYIKQTSIGPNQSNRTTVDKGPVWWKHWPKPPPRLLPAPDAFWNSIPRIRPLPSSSANPPRLLPAPDAFGNSMPHIRPLPFLSANPPDHPKLKKRRLATDTRISEALKLAVGLLKEEFDLRKRASQKFPPEISYSHIRSSVSKYENEMSIASKISICCSCGSFATTGNIHKIVIFTRYYITWLGCRQPYISTSYSDSSINHLIHLIFCNHARLNLRIQQVMSPAWLNATHAFYHQFRVKDALWRPCPSRLKSAWKHVQASTPFNIHCLLLSFTGLSLVLTSYQPHKQLTSRATSRVTSRAASRAVCLTSCLPYELPASRAIRFTSLQATGHPIHPEKGLSAYTIAMTQRTLISGWRWIH